MTRPRILRRVLVTGGAGFIGGHLVRRLVAQQLDVTVLDDLSSPAALPPAGVHFVRGSILDAPLVEGLVAGADAVFHLAALVGVRRVLADPLANMQINTEGTTTVLQACARQRRRVVYTSSSEVYGRGFRSPFSETDPLVLGPPHVSRWCYALSKLHGESLGFELARRHGLPFTAARMFNVVGAGQRADQGMVLPRFVEAAVGGQALRVYAPGTQRRCFMHARDAAQVLWRLMLEGPDEPLVVNVAGNGVATVRELAEMVRAAAGSEAPVEMVEAQSDLPPGFEEIPDRVADTTRLRSLLGEVALTPLQDIVAEAVEAERAKAAGRQVA